jgi:hypothetical protein
MIQIATITKEINVLGVLIHLPQMLKETKEEIKKFEEAQQLRMLQGED